MAQQDTLPVQTQLIINLHQGGQITTSFPTNINLAIYMISETLKIIGQNCEFRPPSPIIQVPPGTKLAS